MPKPTKLNQKIKALIFDFDGVILESSDIKTEAFLELFKEYPQYQQAILEYHIEHQGITRFKKFRWIYKTLLNREYDETIEQQLGEAFSAIVFDKIMKAPFVPGALELLKKMESKMPAFIASGTPDSELIKILENRNLDHFFSAVYGSDLKKEEIIQKIKKEYHFNSSEIVFVGDAVSDFKAAMSENLHFVARDTPPMTNFWAEKNIKPVENLLEILDRYELFYEQLFI